jgi:hypothetical protein
VECKVDYARGNGAKCRPRGSTALIIRMVEAAPPSGARDWAVMNHSLIPMRLRQIDRILGQWNEEEIAHLPSAERRGVALLGRMRQSLLVELSGVPLGQSGESVGRGGTRG